MCACARARACVRADAGAGGALVTRSRVNELATRFGSHITSVYHSSCVWDGLVVYAAIAISDIRKVISNKVYDGKALNTYLDSPLPRLKWRPAHNKVSKRSFRIAEATCVHLTRPGGVKRCRRAHHHRPNSPLPGSRS